ncbi:helix-turn-helix domain-containing protein [Anaerobacterium chartisolvens]|nr:helix-turn-helix domain-containing protein [Anaerobacterium chartisolvens]
MNSIFIKLLFCFTAFIVLSISIVGALSYANSSKRLLQEVKKSNILILKQTRDSIDKELTRINDICLKLALDNRVGKASYLSYEETASNEDIYNDISGFLNSLRETNDIASNIWIRFNKSKNIVNFENVYREDVFLKEVCVYKSKVDWEKVFHENYVLSSIGRQEIYFNYASNPVVTFVRSIPVGSINPTATVAANIDEKMLSNVIGAMNQNAPILTYIIDSKDNVIFCNDQQYQYSGDDRFIKGILDKYAPVASDKEGEINGNIDGKRLTIEFTSSNVNDWRYITLIPNSFIASKVYDIRNITILTVVLSFFVGLILSYILATRVYDPINRIIGYLGIINNNRKVESGSRKGDNEFLFINNIIDYVYSENETLRESFSKSVPMLKEKLLNDLLDGKVADINFKEAIENIGLQLPFNMFQVIVFEIDDYSSMAKNSKRRFDMGVTELIESIASKVFIKDARVYAVKKGTDKVTAIINEGDSCEDIGAFNDFLDKANKYFSQNFGITFTIGIGKAYNGYENCSGSFIEALFALKYKVVKGQNTIIHIDEVSSIPQNIFEYPIESEKHIVNKLKSGDMQSIRLMLDDLFSRNLSGNASPAMINNFFNALVGTLVRTVYEIQAAIEDVFESQSDLYNEISMKNTIMEKKDCILFFFGEVTDFVNSKKSSHNLKVYEKVIKFIENNYERELSLDNVSDSVGLSPSYLSLVFKEVSGMNFVEYVNRYRISQAKILLREIGLTVSEISERAGYSNANTFIKVFKKYEGITPGQFRETYKS